MTKGMAGAGKSRIDFPVKMFPFDGFTGYHDPVYVRSIFFEAGKKQCLLIEVDSTSLMNKYVQRMKAGIKDTFGVAEDAVWICSSHSFNVPHIMPDPKTEEERRTNAMAFEATMRAVMESVAMAANSMREARLRWGTAECGVNCNRDVLTKDGWWLGCNESGFSDKSLKVICLDDSEGKPIAVIANYALQSSVMHGSVMEDGGAHVSGDVFGKASEIVEKEYPDSVTLFLCGAAADQAPVYKARRTVVDSKGDYAYFDLSNGGFTLVNLLGERLGYAVCTAMASAEGVGSLNSVKTVQSQIRCGGQVMPANTLAIRPVKEYVFQTAEEQSVPISLMYLNDIALIGVQPEITNRSAAEFMARYPDKKLCFCTMVNGAAKYMASAESYDLLQYEAINSKYAKGSLERLLNQIDAMLMRGKKESRGIKDV